MREIKFKVVWNRQVSIDAYTIGEFIDGVELDFKDGGSLPMNDIDWGEDKVEYLQFTGLLDKNGEEVYFQDLVRVFAGMEQERVDQVIWNEYQAGFSLQGAPSGHLFGGDQIEVIGNVWENPELVGEQETGDKV